jgi:hypothetical protein
MKAYVKLLERKSLPMAVKICACIFDWRLCWSWSTGHVPRKSWRWFMSVGGTIDRLRLWIVYLGSFRHVYGGYCIVVPAVLSICDHSASPVQLTWSSGYWHWLQGYFPFTDCRVSLRLKLQGEKKIDSDSHPHTHSSITCHILQSSSTNRRLKCGVWLITDAFAYATGRSRKCESK